MRQLAVRERLPETRFGQTHKFEIQTAGNKTVAGFITANCYGDGELAEVFCTVDKEGSTVAGLMDALATILSVALQYGVPLKTICQKLKYMKFEPAGQVVAGDKDLHHAHSMADYLGRWLEKNYLPPDDSRPPTIDPIERGES